ncbi:hypothetical protein ACIQPQ_16040 [Streptomyces sp. NPDC091281]|uniref:hypothetical protein n=1 Tax=Streptomyces sp. NPDC091281 TaxID=3365985 RepID=UPI0037F12909
MKPLSPLVRLTVSAALLGGTGLLTGCGGTDGGGESHADRKNDVASLESPSAPNGEGGEPERSPSAASEQSRPQLRLDSSDAERDQYWNAYASCLKEHGHKMILSRGPYSVDQNDDSPTARAAERTCAGKLPLQPPELDRDKNPHFADDWRAYITCLNKKGLKVVSLPDNSGWNYSGEQTLSEEAQTTVDKACTLEAFGGKNH